MKVNSFSSYRFTPVGHLLVNSPVGELELTASADGIMAVLPVRRDIPVRWVTLMVDMDASTQKSIKRHLALAKKELGAYFRGELTQFSVSLDLQGTDFQQQVWQELQRIPYGSSDSYQAVADRINRPKAVRAVGAANGANPAAIIVPCHRVIGKNGKLTGYVYGLEMKQYLLDLESRSQ
ncbi:methylated-DNA--[protein]-cysteine S-methyltransferase [Endozoicomonas sp.]|uniref:methylated-DNA--[protein]-cysteine S-methyltransferase n=1 Tax=Endozoicomonas sp. TaxID=1892382 RepID=UPI002884A29C|nr:methylated-DNA--[protein]-cysteine S-methyltransferase [Endozoicomonas sp.]